jgi:hypothetical protein
MMVFRRLRARAFGFAVPREDFFLTAFRFFMPSSYAAPPSRKP